MGAHFLRTSRLGSCHTFHTERLIFMITSLG